MNSRKLQTLPLLIQDTPPDDARLLDAAHTLVNLQQTTDRQSRQTIDPDTQRGQDLSHTINLYPPILRSNQLTISPVSPVATVSSGLLFGQFPEPNTSSSISLARSPVSNQMVGSSTQSLVVTSFGNRMAHTGSSTNINTHIKDNLHPERTMMPPPSIGRGGGRGGSSRGIKVKSAAISGVSSGRGRGRGRGRGVSNISGGASQAPKGNSSILTLQTQPAALYMEEKQDHTLSSPGYLPGKSPTVMHAALRIISPSDPTPNEDGMMDDTLSFKDSSNRMSGAEGGSNTDKDNFSDYVNGDDPAAHNDTVESTFMVGGLMVKNSMFDDLLNERKLELFNDPEVMALLSSVMQQSKNHLKTD